MRLSVVLPVYNEADLLAALYERLTAALTPLACDYELLFVNDGSTDPSLQTLKTFHQQDFRVKVINFSRNFGHQIALSAGLHYAQADAVILMDADLQDPPEMLPALLKTFQEGWDVVYAVRRTRREHLFKQIAYGMFYRFLAAISKPSLPLDAGDFSILSRRAVDQINRMPERTRFLRGLRSWIGLKQTALFYDRDKRLSGKPRYTFPKLVLLALNGVVTFSHLPLRLASFMGFVCASLSVLGIIVFVSLRVFTTLFIPGWTSIIITTLFIGSIQLIAIGILGEYIARIYEEVKQRPLFVVDEFVGLSGGSEARPARHVLPGDMPKQ